MLATPLAAPIATIFCSGLMSRDSSEIGPIGHRTYDQWTLVCALRECVVCRVISPPGSDHVPDVMPANVLTILVVYGDVPAGSTVERAGLALVEKLRSHGFEVVTARSAADGVAAIQADPLIGSVLVGADVDSPGGAEQVLRAYRARNDRAPTFLLGARSQVSDIPLSTLKLATEFIWLTEDSTTLIAGRVEAAMRRYRENLLPPMFASMLRQANVHEYAFGTPGHLGGRGLSQDAGITGVLRLLRREHAALGPFDRHGGGGFAARSLRSHRREREIRRAGLRRAPLLHDDQWHLGLEPNDFHGQPHAERHRAVRP